MKPVEIKTASNPSSKSLILLLTKEEKKASAFDFLAEEVKEQIKNVPFSTDGTFFSSDNKNRMFWGARIPEKQNIDVLKEELRLLGEKANQFAQNYNYTEIFFSGQGSSEEQQAFLEGLLLGAYQFDKYKSQRKSAVLEKVEVRKKSLDKKAIKELENTIKAVYFARDLMNEPLNNLNAEKLGEEVKEVSRKSGIKAKVWDRKKIEQEGFSALLEVNRGSHDDPTFTELTWEPSGAANKNPIVLIGKGIVFDTGGLSLKGTLNNMDKMKTDMGGAAAVAGAIYLAALNNLPVKLKGLIPATDNRPGYNAYAPGDVINSHKGHTIEVLNTDAEGRLIMADALSYAERFSPELTIDIATLTGSAANTFGPHAAAIMGNASESTLQVMEKAGHETYERVHPLPLWEEYENLILSDIADVKNSVAGQGSGAIAAGKFLEKFAPTPWLHLDIAGPGYLPKRMNYRGIHGTGFGVRLLYNFLNHYVSKKN